MRTTPTSKRRNVSPIRDSDYDSVVIVVFDEDFQVTAGLKFTREVVEELFAHRPYVNGRIITVTKRLWQHPLVDAVDLSDTARGLQRYDPA